MLLLGGCASLPQNTNRTESFTLRNTATTRIGQMVQADLREHPGKSGFYLLPKGLDAFVARARLAMLAQRSIDVQTYLLHRDMVGRLFIKLLLEAADRGVRVCLLADDMTLNRSIDIDAAELATRPKIEVRVFNPFGRKTPRLLQYVPRRMHNKSFIVNETADCGNESGNYWSQFDASSIAIISHSMGSRISIDALQTGVARLS
ncbi:MAG: phospholipase D-like domain-containing protein [Gammaproteobacteria bacterium]|nr:phospholipase D-like domain-containing protein [Gammaproteobacteria bacterium]